MIEPLTHLLNKYGFRSTEINNIVFGDKYLLVELKNKQIGVCATLQNLASEHVDIDVRQPDLNNINHRQILNAYFNAHLNQAVNHYENGDIFNTIDFNTFNNIIMIGNFRPLVQKFDEKAIALTVFDLLNDDERLTDISLQDEYVKQADAIILTATSISNNTFLNITNQSPAGCDIFLLGPSSILHEDMFEYKNIKMIFGTRFSADKQEIMEIIKQGHGTRKFMPYSEKVFLRKR